MCQIRFKIYYIKIHIRNECKRNKSRSVINILYIMQVDNALNIPIIPITLFLTAKDKLNTLKNYYPIFFHYSSAF